MGLTYEVELDFTTKGAGAFERMGSMIGSVMAPLDMVVSSVAKLGAALVSIGGTAAFGGLIWSVTKLNAEMEKTTISVASMLQAQGAVSSIGQGMGISVGLMQSMREHAKELPGEFRDLVAIFRTGLVPAMQAGLSPEHFEKMSAKVMAAAAVTGLDMHMAAREFGMLLGGRAGAHNVLGTRLAGLTGDKAKEFNRMAPDKRAAFLEKEVNKYGDSVQFFKNSWDGVSSTMVDSIKMFSEAATTNLFDKVKRSVGEMNDWFSGHEKEWTYIADQINWKLGSAFEHAKALILEWGPVVWQFAEDGYSYIMAMWQKVEPLVERLGAKIKAIFQDGNLFGKAESVLGKLVALVIGGKVAGATMSLGSSVMSQTGRVAQTVAPFLVQGAAGGASAASSAFGALGPAIPYIVAGLTVLAQVVVVLGVAVFGAYSAITDATSTFHGVASELWANISENGIEMFKHLGYALSQAWHAAKPLVEMMGVTLLWALDLLLAWFKRVADGIAIAMTALASFSDWLFGWIGKLLGLKPGEKANVDRSDWREEAEYMAERKAMVNGFMESFNKNGLGGQQSGVNKGGNQGKPQHPGGANMSIQKVEIVVTSNQEPSRIAREVFHKLAEIQKHPRVSRDAPNWSAAVPVGA